MMQTGVIGLGAGAASALLFASIASGRPLSLLLANLAQLPIMLAAIGWTHYAALIAVLLASAGIAAFLGAAAALAFMISIGLPAWWLGYLALLARPVGNGAAAGIEWYPVGRIVVWTALAAAAVVLLSLLRHGFEAAEMQAGLRRELEQGLRFLARLSANEPLRLPSVKDPGRLLDVLVLMVPPMKASALTMMSLFNLWLAAVIARISGRLQRPWPTIAQMTFPPFAPMVLALALAGTFLPDAIGIASGILTAALLLAYALLGLAVMHAITSGIGGRRLMLSGLYLTVALFGWPIVLMSLLGLLETLLGLRARHAARRPRSPTPPPT